MPVEKVMARKIAVIVKPNTKSPGVIQLSERDYRVAVREPARDGKANRAVIELLAHHLGVPKSQIKILRGQSSRNKIVEIA
jgi:uncharacterized protein (TIGR00251 family)